MAKSITLYDQPKSDAKVVGTIDSEKGYVPIFTPKDDSQWAKIGDPQNGNVGWVKSSDLKVDSKNGYTFSEHIITQGNGPHSYVIQFGEPKKMTDAEMKEYTKKMYERQQALQHEMQRMMQEINEISTHFPMIMPVVIVPENVNKSNQKDKK